MRVLVIADNRRHCGWPSYQRWGTASVQRMSPRAGTRVSQRGSPSHLPGRWPNGELAAEHRCWRCGPALGHAALGGAAGHLHGRGHCSHGCDDFKWWIVTGSVPAEWMVDRFCDLQVATLVPVKGHLNPLMRSPVQVFFDSRGSYSRGNALEIICIISQIFQNSALLPALEFPRPQCGWVLPCCQHPRIVPGPLITAAPQPHSALDSL